MNRYIKLSLPVLAIIFFSCGSQRYVSDDRRDRNYGNVLSNDGRYYDDYGYNSADGWNSLESVKVAARKEEKRIKVTRREGKNISQFTSVAL